MVARQPADERGPHRFLRHVARQQTGFHLIGEQGGDASDRPPVLQTAFAIDEVQEELLVVAPQEDRLGVARALNQVGDDAGTAGASINVVPQIDLGDPGGGWRLLVFVDLAMGFLQKIEAPMDVADRIDRAPLRSRGIMDVGAGDFGKGQVHLDRIGRRRLPFLLGSNRQTPGILSGCTDQDQSLRSKSS